MPENSQRIHAEHRARVTKIVEAPLTYVYGWCTDFRTDDGRFSRSRPRYQVLRPRRDRVVRIRASRSGSDGPLLALELIRLRPPDGWHVDQIDERDLETVDYRLHRLGPHRTRVTLDIVERWMSADHPRKAEWVKDTEQYWDELVSAIEVRYRAGRPAKGQ